MFWHVAGLSTASPVEAILDKENFTLEELLDEDEIIQECKALNCRLISFLREKDQIKKLIKYIVEEAPDDGAKQRMFKFPFVACEIFTCEVDILLNALVEDEELMELLFGYLDPERPHSTLSAGYFSKVVICLLVRNTIPLMSYIRAHQDIIKKLVDLIGITSIMEVFIRLIDADEHLYANGEESVQWLEDINVLDMIVDKFSSSDSPEVHANSAEILCTITRYASSGLASKISSPSFIGKLFRHALEELRPKSVLVNLLSVCICLLDPKRLSPGLSYMYGRQMGLESGITANTETVQGMLEGLGDLLKLLDPSSEDKVMLTTYGKLQPPFGKHRLKIVEFIAVLVGVSSDVAEKELISLGAVSCIFKLFFEYPFNNFLHHHVEHIVTSCLESKNLQLVCHLLRDCNLLDKILEADRNPTLAIDASKPTVPAEGRSPPRIGNIGHLTRVANKLVQLGNNDSSIQELLQGNSDWVDWQTNVLLKLNSVENVFQWACGRPTTLHDRTRDSDDDDYQDRDFDVAALANNPSQAFQSGLHNDNDMAEAHGSSERDNEDKHFGEESADVVISSLHLADNQESGSLFTNSKWFQFENSSDLTASFPTLEEEAPKDKVVEGDEGLAETAMSNDEHENATTTSDNNPQEFVDGSEIFDSVELIPASDSSDALNEDQNTSTMPNGDIDDESEIKLDDSEVEKTHDASPHSSSPETDGGDSTDDPKESSDSDVSLQRATEADEGNQNNKIDST